MKPVALSLSLLDVLSCALGATILLFMLVARNAEQLQARTGASQPGTVPEAAFVLLVYFDQPGTVQQGFQKSLAFEIENSGVWSGVTTNVAHDFAILYGRTPPPRDSVIKLRIPESRGGQAVRIETLLRGVRLTRAAIAGTESLPLWPADHNSDLSAVQ